ncbi:hypothetical protein [Streptomyces sp. NPDC050988]|uniref:hypothetical protein n=1 Tax=Streptomyces sp. NPDC050988 TaxID=3365637 RepID=UPI0037B1F496
MSPELRTRSSLSPLATRGAWLTGGAVASLALVFAGVATPASASVTPAADSVVAGPSNEDCKKENGHHEKYQPEGKAQTPTGPGHEECEDRDRDRDKQECSDIDSVVLPPRIQDPRVELSAVLIDGKAFAGQRTFNGEPSEYEWDKISDNRGFPDKACAISISTDGDDDAWIKVLTKNGRVYETAGSKDDSEFTWDNNWEKLETPRERDLATREKGEMVTPVG